jgi:predicted small secreted protein
MKRALFLALTAILLAGCGNPQKTVDQIRQEIIAYKADPSDARQATIEADLTRLDGQIEKLQAKGKTSEASGYRTSADNLRADYRAARMVRAMKDAQSAIQGIGEAFKDAGKSIGDAFREKTTPTPAP